MILAIIFFSLFILCFIYWTLCGLLRMAGMCALLLTSSFASFYTWQLSPRYIAPWLSDPPTWFYATLSSFSFVAVFITLKKIITLMSRILSFQNSSEAKSNASWVTRLILSIIPTSAFSILFAAVIHHFGTLQSLVQNKHDAPSKLIEWSQSIQSTLPEKWLARIDPATQSQYLNRLKTIIHASKYPAEIDRETGKPYPRAQVVNDPELQQLARASNIYAIFQHPKFWKNQ
jgi:hypothetical protein